MVRTVLLYGRYILTATRPVSSFHVSGLVCVRCEFHKCSDVLICSHAEFLRVQLGMCTVLMCRVDALYISDLSRLLGAGFSCIDQMLY